MFKEEIKVIKNLNTEGLELIDSLISQGIDEIKEYLIIGNKKQEFKRVYHVLKDKYTIHVEEPYEIFGQTIDGDWLMYKDNKILFIHKSLDKNMVEEFKVSIREFLIKLIENKLESKWIAR